MCSLVLILLLLGLTVLTLTGELRGRLLPAVMAGLMAFIVAAWIFLKGWGL